MGSNNYKFLLNSSTFIVKKATFLSRMIFTAIEIKLEKSITIDENRYKLINIDEN